MPISPYYRSVIKPATATPNPDPSRGPDGEELPENEMYLGSIRAGVYDYTPYDNRSFNDKSAMEAPITQVPDRRMPEIYSRQSETVVPTPPEKIPMGEPSKPFFPQRVTQENSDIMQAEKLSDLPADRWLQFLGQVGKATAIPIAGKKPEETLSGLTDKLYEGLQKDKALRQAAFEKEPVMRSQYLQNQKAQLDLEAMPRSIQQTQDLADQKIRMNEMA